MSEVIAFCERHGISSLQHLLDHCGPTTHMRELLAVKVLEDLSVNDPEKLGELSKIRSKLDPVEMMAKIRATAKKQEEKILEATKIKQALTLEFERLGAALRKKKRANQAVTALTSEVKRMEAALLQMRAAPAVIQEPHESQALEYENGTQPLDGDQDDAIRLAHKDDEEETQGGNFDQDAALRSAEEETQLIESE